MSDTAAATERHGFFEASAVRPNGPGRFSAEVDPGWTIGSKPNGGYLLAMLGRAAASVGGHPDVIAASAQYVHAPSVGPVEVTAEVMRAGRSASQVRACLAQDGQVCVAALVTTAALDRGASPYWDAGLPAMGQSPFDRCVRVESSPPGTEVRFTILDQVDLRLEPESYGFTMGAPSGRGELRGWLALPAGEPFDPISLLFAVDSFPPATFDIAASGWVPTLELTVYVRALPVPGPVRVLQRAQLVAAQRVDEACFVWDASGRLVAQATQLAGVRLG